ncbi:hypothetical protein HPB52_002950 [Rhipicephalus sanguineus]|uniref:Uncharacterized protein n=1 Tax=Rhipicephalus sanguineus TaxID=34632 RepID=A0A9D4PEN2_RHISA|nr:hypothetical protein HPB52_002950 [Rhipicephalus sanguineus]
MATQLTEVYWNFMRPHLRRKPSTASHSRGSVTYLQAPTVPPDIHTLLEKGPKFSLEPSVPPSRLLSTVHRIASKAPSEEKEHCISEGVDCLLHCGERPRRKGERAIRSVVSYFREHNLSLLQADKEGGFVVLTRELFSEKAMLVVTKNFKPVTLKPAKLKTKAIKFLSEANLDKLANEGAKAAVRESLASLHSCRSDDSTA